MGVAETWFGNWRARVAGRARACGFSDVTALATAKPDDSIFELAATLGDDVAASQILMLLMEEAVAARSVLRAYADILARELRDALPAGWPADLDEATRVRIASVFSLLTADLGGYQESDAGIAVREFLTTGAPAGWRPSSGNDPIVRRLAERRILARLKPS